MSSKTQSGKLYKATGKLSYTYMVDCPPSRRLPDFSFERLRDFIRTGYHYWDDLIFNWFDDPQLYLVYFRDHVTRVPNADRMETYEVTCFLLEQVYFSYLLWLELHLSYQKLEYWGLGLCQSPTREVSIPGPLRNEFVRVTRNLTILSRIDEINLENEYMAKHGLGHRRFVLKKAFNNSFSQGLYHGLAHEGFNLGSGHTNYEPLPEYANYKDSMEPEDVFAQVCIREGSGQAMAAIEVLEYMQDNAPDGDHAYDLPPSLMVTLREATFTHHVLREVMTTFPKFHDADNESSSWKSAAFELGSTSLFLRMQVLQQSVQAMKDNAHLPRAVLAARRGPLDCWAMFESHLFSLIGHPLRMVLIHCAAKDTYPEGPSPRAKKQSSDQEPREVPDVSVATTPIIQSGHSYLQQLVSSGIKAKAKTRSEAVAVVVDSGEQQTKEVAAALPAFDATTAVHGDNAVKCSHIWTISGKQFKIVKRLFDTSEEPLGQMRWDAILKILRMLGFQIQGVGGSITQFTPPASLSKRTFVDHAPHEPCVNAIRYRNMGARLGKLYGITLDNFELKRGPEPVQGPEEKGHVMHL